MAVSGSKDFEPDVAEYVEEAFERCGLELRTGYDLRTARRSMNLMLAEWANRGLNQWTIQQNTIAMVKDQTVYNIDSTNGTAAIDVLDVFVRETIQGTATDIPLSRMSRAEYSHLATKSTTGKPNQFFIDKQITPTITVWPAPDKNTTYTLYCNTLTRMDDADAGANTLQMPFRFYPCLVAGLAYYLALKKAPEKVQLLKGLYEEEFTRALSQDEERASFRVSPDLRNYNIA
jgi:rhodanese-related sulfurtransferase